jgi:hypothetical protein
MHSNVALIVVLVGSLAALSARAEDTQIDIKTDVKGTYFLVEKAGTAANPTLIVKRARPGSDYYVKREFDCAAHTVRNLGEGESLEATAEAQSNVEAGPIQAGSISDQLSRIACANR